MVSGSLRDGAVCHGHDAAPLMHISISTTPFLTPPLYIIIKMRMMVLTMAMRVVIMMTMMTRDPVSWGNARGTSTSPVWRTTTATTAATTTTTPAATTATQQCYNVAKGENTNTFCTEQVKGGCRF